MAQRPAVVVGAVVFLCAAFFLAHTVVVALWCHATRAAGLHTTTCGDARVSKSRVTDRDAPASVGCPVQSPGGVGVTYRAPMLVAETTNSVRTPRRRDKHLLQLRRVKASNAVCDVPNRKRGPGEMRGGKEYWKAPWRVQEGAGRSRRQSGQQPPPAAPHRIRPVARIRNRPRYIRATGPAQSQQIPSAGQDHRFQWQPPECSPGVPSSRYVTSDTRTRTGMFPVV